MTLAFQTAGLCCLSVSTTRGGRKARTRSPGEGAGWNRGRQSAYPWRRRPCPAQAAPARLRSPRAALYAFLVAAAGLLGWGAYTLSAANSRARFYAGFASRSAAAGQQLAERVALLSDGGQVLAAAAHTLSSLPNSSLPNFAALANATSALTLALHIAFNPVVEAGALGGWLAWAAANAPAGATPAPASPPGALRLFVNGTFVAGVPATPFSVPVWQTFPAADEAPLAFFDAASDPAGFPTLACAVASAAPCLTGVLLGPPFDAPFSVIYVPVKVRATHTAATHTINESPANRF